MTRDVMLSISGADGISSRVRAEYFCRNGGHYLLYEEASSDFGSAVKSRIKFKGGRLEISRQGTPGTMMVIEAGRSHGVDYATPYGMLPLEVAGGKISFQETDNHIRIDAEYILKTNGQPLSDCRIEIIIQAI